MSNILRVGFKDKTIITSKPLYQYDYGQVLKFVDLDLPASYEVHFSNYEHGDSTTTVATTNEVAIPDAYLQTGLDVYAWLYIHTGNNDGETEYQVNIPIIKRASITNETPTATEASAISQAIAALNTVSSAISQNLSDSQAALEGAQQARNVARGYRDDCNNILSQIQDSAGLGYITIGQTRLTEANLIALLQLIEE